MEVGGTREVRLVLVGLHLKVMRMLVWMELVGWMVEGLWLRMSAGLVWAEVMAETAMMVGVVTLWLR